MEVTVGPTTHATRAPFASGRADAVAAPLAGSLNGVSTVIGFDGQSAADNRRVFGFAFVPPDTNGAVGASQYVQMVNVTIAVYSKRDGSLQLGPAPIHSLWHGFGGLCENGGETDVFSDGGDPVVLWRLPPAGAPNYFVGLADATHLNLFRFHADFANPAASTFGAPMLIEVAPYVEICARATTASCIPEPEPGEKVDGLSDRVMFRLAYRNFGDHEALVVNHTVRGGALGGVRW